MILFGAGNEGRNALNFVNKEEVLYFVDNDKRKWGTEVNQIPVKEPTKENIGENQVYITTSWKHAFDIKEQLGTMKIKKADFFQEYLKTNDIRGNHRIRELKGRYSQKRCFLIGTGPSLRAEDLEALNEQQEFCFASNKIFKIFDTTKWRPDFYCISDIDVFQFYFEQINELNLKNMFLVNLENSKYADTVNWSKMNQDNIFIFNTWYAKNKIDGRYVPAFSEDPWRYVVDGGITVTYAMLQFAYFLGFQEVYLLGVDFNYSDKTGNDSDQRDHFCSNYVEKGEVVNYPKLEDTLMAYQAAEEFSESHNFKIYNATRGGKLKVFERVELEDILRREGRKDG